MSITFRKRPDHTLSLPEAKEPHLDLHSIDARADQAPIDDDIPVLLPEPAASTQSTSRIASGIQAAGTPANRQQAVPPGRANSPMPVQQRAHTDAVHIPAPPMTARRHTPVPDHPAWQDDTDDMPVLMPAQRPVQPPPVGTTASPRPTPMPPPAPRQPAVTPPATPLPPSGLTETPAAPAAFPGHPAPDDYAPFLHTARGVQGHHSKPELYVWSDDENDAFSQAAQADFTLNRIQPTAGRPSFDSSLFRAPSRPDALAGTVMPTVSQSADQTAAMQTEIDALVTELLDESHEYLKRRLLEEIPEIIAKYRGHTE